MLGAAVLLSGAPGLATSWMALQLQCCTTAGFRGSLGHVCLLCLNQVRTQGHDGLMSRGLVAQLKLS